MSLILARGQTIGNIDYEAWAKLDVNTILSFRRLDMIGLISSLTIKWEPRANVTLRVRNSGQGLT